MNIKPPNKKDETHRKYKYLIWRDDVGFMHLDSFSSEELKKFSASITEEYASRNLEENSEKAKKSLTIKDT